jgi:chemotaxis protein methyltransferase CheR
MKAGGCVPFLQWALPRLGMRWAGFRKVRGQVCKGIAHRIRELGLADFPDYRRYLEAEAGEWVCLDSLCRVTISRFHRDRGVFELIRDRLLPELAEAARMEVAATGSPHFTALGPHGSSAPPSQATVECWSAGCASGEEPFTLSILWGVFVQDRFPDVRLKVLATDADEALLGRARAARYPSSSIRELGPKLVDFAFHGVDGELVLRRPLQEGVVLRQEDIRFGMPEGPFHLILCRNLVFTYFEGGLQATLLGRMLERLRPSGYLVVGTHEDLPPGEWPLERVGTGMPMFRHA